MSSPNDKERSNEGRDVDKTRILQGAQPGSDETRVVTSERLSELAVGTEFAGYLIESEIARGQMGVVYRVKNLRLERTEALKVIALRYAADPDFRARFRREAMNAAVADHPHVVRVYDAHQFDGRLYIAMQFVDGIDLRRRLARERVLPVAVAVDITCQVASALDTAHAHGLVHRDVKPSNILLAGTAYHPVAYLSDFGVSRRLAMPSDLTAPGSMVGTPYYTAPEQHLGEAVDHRADVYALGCVLFEMLTGRVPFPGTTTAAVAIAHCSDPVPSPHAVNASVPPALDPVIAKALAKNPDDRYDSAGSLAAALAAAVAVEEGAGRSSPTELAVTEPASSEETLIVPGRADPTSTETLIVDPGAGSASAGSQTATGLQEDRRGTARHGPRTATTADAERRQRPHRRRAVIWLLAIVAVAALIAVVIWRTTGGTSGIPATVTPPDGAHVRVGPNQALAGPALSDGSHVTVICKMDGWDRLGPRRYVFAPLLKPQARVPRCP